MASQEKALAEAMPQSTAQSTAKPESTEIEVGNKYRQEKAIKNELSRVGTNYNAIKRIEDNEEYASIYDGSVYRELLFFKQTHSLSGLLFGSVILLMQGYIYFQFLRVARKNIGEPEFNIIGKIDVCDEKGNLWANNIGELSCSADGGFKGTFWSMSTPAILVAAWTFGDVLSSLKVLFISDFGLWGKIIAVCVLMVQFLAVYSGALFGFEGINNGSTFDAVVNCVGVLFVNDIDEVVESALEKFDSNVLCKCCVSGLCKCCDCCKNENDDKKGCCSKHAKIMLFVGYVFCCFLCMVFGGFGAYKESEEFYETFDSSDYYQSNTYYGYNQATQAPSGTSSDTSYSSYNYDSSYTGY